MEHWSSDALVRCWCPAVAGCLRVAAIAITNPAKVLRKLQSSHQSAEECVVGDVGLSYLQDTNNPPSTYWLFSTPLAADVICQLLCAETWSLEPAYQWQYRACLCTVWAALHLPYLKYSLWWINVQHIFRYFSDFVGRDLMPIFWQYSMLSLRSWHVHSAGPGRVNLELWKEPEWVLPHLICILFLTMELRCLRYGFCLIVKLGVANQAWNYNGYGLLIANYNVSTCHFILDFWETNDRHQ